jgi:hypothetical protein
LVELREQPDVVQERRDIQQFCVVTDLVSISERDRPRIAAKAVVGKEVRGGLADELLCFAGDG